MRLTAAIATPPVSLEAFKAHARIEHAEEDAVLQAMLDAATAFVETGSARPLTPRSAAFTVAAPFTCWWFPAAPVASLTSVKVLRADGAEVAVDAALVGAADQPRLVAEVEAWPEAMAGDVIEVRAEVGYDPAQPQPEVAALKNAIIMLAVDREMHRSASMAGDSRPAPFGVGALIRQNRYVRPRVAFDLCGRSVV